MTAQITSGPVIQDDMAFQLNNTPRRTLFFSVSEASERTPEFNLVVNFVDWFYRSIQSWITADNLPTETVFEHQDAAEYRLLVEIVIDRLLEMCYQDGIKTQTYWNEAEDGEEAVTIWFYDSERNPSKMLKLICTDEEYLKETAAAMAELSNS